MRALSILAVLSCLGQVQAGTITYDWNADDEGFAPFQGPWSRVGDAWGGSIGGFHSSRLVEITGLNDAATVAAFEAFLESQAAALSELTITIDVFKESSNGWKPPTGLPVPPFNDAFNNTHSSLIFLWIAHEGVQYSFGAELDGVDGLQQGIQLPFLGLRSQAPNFSVLEGWLQTHQGGSNGTVSYAIDNVSIIPEPTSALLVTFAGLAAMRRRPGR
ncbi:MAG: hypothetical protein V3W34_08010 [Phycisphaerae bacterium]